MFRPKKMSTEEESTLEESTLEESTLPGLCPPVTAQGVGGLVFCGGEEAAFKLEELMRASADMMGKGTAGSTYKAAVTAEMTVSVKRVDAARMTSSGREAFERHMETVGRLRHPNLVPLRAYFQAKEERLLVYEYQPNGSLFSLIHGESLEVLITVKVWFISFSLSLGLCILNISIFLLHLYLYVYSSVCI